MDHSQGDIAKARMARARANWTPPGPLPPGDQGDPTLTPQEGESLNCFAGHWMIFQMRRGHRYSTDDLLAASFALDTLRAFDRAPQRILDLGSGIGSVGLFQVWALPEVHLVGVERQAISVGLARKTARYNGVDERVVFHHRDLRGSLGDLGAFEAITGSPPYWATQDGILSDGPQKGPARFEVTGTVEDYCNQAASCLRADGIFTLVFDGRQRPRLEEALEAADLNILRIQDVRPKEGKPPLMTLVSASPRQLEAPLELDPLTLRLESGKRHPAFRALRLKMGLPPGKG